MWDKPSQLNITGWLYLSNTSSTLILDDQEIPKIKQLKYDSSGAEFSKELSPVGCLDVKAGTLENLLMWSRNRRQDHGDDHSPLPQALTNIMGIGESGGSSMAGGSHASETPDFKRLSWHPTVTTPSKVNEGKKHKRGEAEESNAEASFVADTQAASGRVGAVRTQESTKDVLWMTMLPARERPKLVHILSLHVFR
ncbi:hypothetical protein Tco_0684768 [Tanacetum coccineum]